MRLPSWSATSQKHDQKDPTLQCCYKVSHMPINTLLQKRIIYLLKMKMSKEKIRISNIIDVIEIQIQVAGYAESC